MRVSRRTLLTGAVAGLGVVVLGDVADLFGTPPSRPAPKGGREALQPDPDDLLDLPPDFHYRVISREGDQLAAGGVVPGRFDGQAAFAGERGVVLVRNHELHPVQEDVAFADVGLADAVYDRGAVGGTTTLVLDERGDRVVEYVSLAGTAVNCAGGPTPWGTWLTCEETESRRGAHGFRKDHGWVFEVDPSSGGDPRPIEGMGRFQHEAVAVDPDTGDCYLTEDVDEPNGLVYRFRPHEPLGGRGSLHEGGELAALACSLRGEHIRELAAITEVGTTLQCRWRRVPDPSALTHDPMSTRRQFGDGEVTRGHKLEGAWWGDGRAHLVSSYADGEHQGQVWSFDPEHQTLTLDVRFGADRGDVAGDRPDNITVSPWGGVLLAEDGDGDQYLVAVGDDGDAWPLARNALNDGEFAGVVLSPDRTTLYANLQTPGITYAITGPFG